MLPTSAIVSHIITRIGFVRSSIWIGWMTTCIASVLLLILSKTTRTVVWVLIFLLFGSGNGVILTSISFYMQGNVAINDAGTVAGIYTFMRSLGMSVGVALGGTAFQNSMLESLASQNLSEHIAHEAERYVSVLKSMDQNADLTISIIDAYLRGFRGVFILMVCTSLLGLMVTSFLSRVDLSKLLE